MNVEKEILKEAKKAIDLAQSIVITCHVNPDGDAIGSSLGLAQVLKELNKDVTVIVPSAFPTFLDWMNGIDQVIDFENNVEKATSILNATDLIIYLDYNSLKRSGSMQGALANCIEKGTAGITIDHHQLPDNFSSITISDSDMSSTCEMIAHFIKTNSWHNHLKFEGAECLYTGLITDTGGFKYSATTSKTHEVAADLLEIGVRPEIISSRIYDTNSVNRLKLLSKCLERMELFEDLGVALLHLTEQDLIDAKFKRGDTEGFVNYGLSIKGNVCAAFMYPRDGMIKMSFRSKGNFDVNLFARKHFGGGGHKNAAGGALEIPLEECLQLFKTNIVHYEAELKNSFND